MSDVRENRRILRVQSGNIASERITQLNSRPVNLKGQYVFYWMQASQRTRYNHALEHAVYLANSLKKPLFVLFVLSPAFPGANLRHYSFMLQGLKETRSELKERGLNLILTVGEPAESVIKAASRAALVITDRGYTRIQKEWRKRAAEALKCPLIQVESDVIVPVEAASPKEEYAAATIRNKIKKRLPDFIASFRTQKPLIRNYKPILKSVDFDISALLQRIKADPSVGSSPLFKGGYSEAQMRLKSFIVSKLSGYGKFANDPSTDYESCLSPYLHFGQISPLHIAIEVLKAGEKVSGPFLEQLIIRRELACNFVNYNSGYDSIECLPAWALKTIKEHEGDKRPYLYSIKELEGARTHDPYWNAAQRQMALTGKMHGYMRMYWGKKVIEWTGLPAEAYSRLVYLNDKYELDGRDPNGYAGIAWLFGKHDRAWSEREVFGKVRYMNDKGLERKFNMDYYISKTDNPGRA